MWGEERERERGKQHTHDLQSAGGDVESGRGGGPSEGRVSEVPGSEAAVGRASLPSDASAELSAGSLSDERPGSGASDDASVQLACSTAPASGSVPGVSTKPSKPPPREPLTRHR